MYWLPRNTVILPFPGNTSLETQALSTGVKLPCRGPTSLSSQPPGTFERPVPAIRRRPPRGLTVLGGLWGTEEPGASQHIQSESFIACLHQALQTSEEMMRQADFLRLARLF